MKRFLTIFAIIFMISSLSCEGSMETSPSSSAAATTKAVQQNAFTQIPVPMVKYFVERQTVAKWYDRWDKPQVTTFVYLIDHGVFIGYYVCNGKPASTRSYLNPESIDEVYGGSSAYTTVNKQQADLDGTYGDNNPGIRFFTAEGTAVEFGGQVSYLYSDKPLPINCPRLNYSEKK